MSYFAHLSLHISYKKNNEGGSYVASAAVLFRSCLCGVSGLVSGLRDIYFDQLENVSRDSNLFAKEGALLLNYVFISPYLTH